MTPTSASLEATYGRYYKWLVTITVMIGMMGTIMTSTMVNVAIADIMGTYGVGQEMAQWLSTGFLSAMTVAMLVTAWLLQAFGIRATYLTAIAIFTVASLIGETAPNIYTVIFARVMQGTCAGLLQPLSMAAIFPLFPPQSRGRAMGYFAMGVVLGPAIGPTVGGIIVDYLHWRHVFTAVLPLCLIGALMGTVFLPGREESGPRPSFNWFSFFAVTVSISTLLIAISKGQSWGWFSKASVFLFAAALFSGAGFLLSELRSRQPLMGIKLFRSLHFSACALISFIFGGALFSSIYLIPLFVRIVQNSSATTAGLVLMPAGLALVLVFPIAGRIADKVSMFYPIFFGLAIFSVSTVALGFIDADTGFWTLAGWTIFGRIALGFIFPSLSRGALDPLTPALIKYGSSAINFTRMLGGAIGVNLTAMMLDRNVDTHRQMLSAAQTLDHPTVSELLTQISNALSQTGLTEAEMVPLSLEYLARLITSKATTMAYQDGFILLGAVGFLSLIPTIFIVRKPQEML